MVNEVRSVQLSCERTESARVEDLIQRSEGLDSELAVARGQVESLSAEHQAHLLASSLVPGAARGAETFEAAVAALRTHQAEEIGSLESELGELRQARAARLAADLEAFGKW